MQSGVLDVRIGFSSDDSGGLHFWVQQRVCMPDGHDDQRFQRIFARIDNLVRDLNLCHSYVDYKSNICLICLIRDGRVCAMQFVRIGSGCGFDD